MEARMIYFEYSLHSYSNVDLHDLKVNICKSQAQISTRKKKKKNLKLKIMTRQDLINGNTKSTYSTILGRIKKLQKERNWKIIHRRSGTLISMKNIEPVEQT